MGFQAMITSVPCMTDKVTLKTARRIISIMREKRTRQTAWSQQDSVLSRGPLVLAQ